MGRSVGVTEFLNKTFIVYPFENEFAASFGQPEKNFVMSIYGTSGNGKTEFSVKFAKYLSTFTKVLYCSYEQGISKSLQDSLIRNNMQESNGNIFFTAGEPMNELIERLQRKKSPNVIIIDSLDYMKLTTEQFKTLRGLFKRKSFIIVSWANNDKPKSQYAKDIEYMSDIKVLVKNFKALPRCRFGGNKPFVIWNKKGSNTGEQGQLF